MSLDHVLAIQTEAFQQRLARDEEIRERRAKNGPSEHESLFVRAIRARLNRKQDARIIVGGEGGIGKSALSASAAEILDPEIYVNDIKTAVDKAISFSALQYMDSTTLPSESVLDFDEPGQGWYHRQFMSEANQILAQTFIGNRFQQFITFLNVPTMALIDVDAIRMCHFFIWIEKQGNAQVYRILNQKFGGEPRYKSIIDSMPFPMPRPELWKSYNVKKEAFQTQLYARFRKQLLEGSAPKLTNYEIADAIIQETDERRVKMYMRDDDKETVDYAKIQDLFGVGVNRAYSIKSTVTRKLAEKRARSNL